MEDFPSTLQTSWFWFLLGGSKIRRHSSIEIKFVAYYKFLFLKTNNQLDQAIADYTWGLYVDFCRVPSSTVTDRNLQVKFDTSIVQGWNTVLLINTLRVCVVFWSLLSTRATLSLASRSSSSTVCTRISFWSLSSFTKDCKDWSWCWKTNNKTILKLFL